LLRSANNLFQLTDPLSLLVNEQLRVANDVDEQDVPNLELEIRLRMSGHIPLRRRNYTPYTPIYQQNSLIRVYAKADNVIETYAHAGVSKSGSHYFGLSRETAGATTRIDMQWLQPPSNPEASEVYRFYLP